MKIPEELVQFLWGIYPDDSAGFGLLESEAAGGARTHDVNAGYYWPFSVSCWTDTQMQSSNTSGAHNRRDTISAPGGHRVFFEELRRQIIAMQRKACAR
jgi:hypothetical protein